MKYYLLSENTKNKAGSLKNRNTLAFKRQYYNNELFNSDEIIEISFNFDPQNQYLPFKNVMTFYGLTDSFLVDKSTRNLLENQFSDCLSFISTKVIDDDKYGDGDFYIMYFNNLISGLNREKSIINFRLDDIFVVESTAELPLIFKFNNCKTLTFADETFKKFVEENNIEGWIFREAFEK